MIDIRKLKELVRLMVSHDLTEIDLRDSEEQVTLRRGHNATVGAGGIVYQVPPPDSAAPPVTAHAAGSAQPQPPVDAAAEDLVSIRSPMVGTFFAKPGPDAQPFVSVGSRVEPDTVVCLIEAMKIFNEIKAETSGTVQRVLVSSSAAVEFGQPLFLVKPD